MVCILKQKVARLRSALLLVVLVDSSADAVASFWVSACARG